MLDDERRSFRPRIRTSHVVAGAVLVLITTGGATAAAGMITGKDIKNGTITTKDVKNGSLKLKDFKKSERKKLRGPAGPAGPAGGSGATGATGNTGSAGPAGASAFTPPPSGTVIKGGGILNVQVSAASVPMRDYSPLPFTGAVAFTDGAGGNLRFGSTAYNGSLFGGQLDTTACAGTSAAPVPAAGKMCIYPLEVTNANDLYVYGGSDSSGNQADRNGFYLYTASVAAGAMTVRYVWAYKAP